MEVFPTSFARPVPFSIDVITPVEISMVLHPHDWRTLCFCSWSGKSEVPRARREVCPLCGCECCRVLELGCKKASWVIPVCCAPQPHRAQSPRLVRGSRSLPAFSISLVGEGSAARAKLADLEALRAQWNHIFILYSRSFDMKYQGGSC